MASNEQIANGKPTQLAAFFLPEASLVYCSALKMAEIRYFETSVNFCRPAWRNIPEVFFIVTAVRS
jgi:hypothetical protein